jgi:hypothetical protein
LLYILAIIVEAMLAALARVRPQTAREKPIANEQAL